MDPIFKFPASPGTPLFPVSPERANRQHLPALPQSPSLPSNLSGFRDDPFTTHARNNSDVQGKVAQFNNLSKEAVQRRRDNEAALKRAVVGREEAEGETRRLREECRTLRKEIEEGRGRERRVGERLEGVIEELHRAKETHSHSQALYEKEIRRARKDAFKTSSNLVKLQEELKSTRNAFSALRENTELQREKVERREQEAFAAQYQLVGVQEELEEMRQQIKLVEEEREILKSNLKEEEVARMAAEGWLDLPVSRDADVLAPPKKEKRRERRESWKENLDPEIMAEEEQDVLALLKEELRVENKLRLKAEDLVHFMKMECQFQCCSCRLAERQGVEYIHDGSLAAKMEDIYRKRACPAETLPPATESANMLARSTTPDSTAEALIDFSPSTGTFHIVPPHPKNLQQLGHLREPARRVSEDATAVAAQPNPRDTTPALLLEEDFHQSLVHAPHPQPDSIPSTPRRHVFNSPPPKFSIPAQLQRPYTTRVISTTTTVPLADVFTPSMSREEALEQIRQRRGRARSIATGNLTPRRQMVEGAGTRRDVSAPVGRA